MRSKLTLCALGCLLFTLGSAQWLERQVLIGDTLGGVNYPEGIVVNPVSGNVYIETSPCDQVFNPATMQKVRGFDWGWVAFCPASGKGYLCRRDSAAVIDATADTLIGQIALPLRSPWAFAYSPLSNRLYLGSDSDETLLVFDPVSDSVVHKVGVGGDVLRLLWDSTWNRLYIGADSDSGLLKVLDCTADTLLPGILTGVNHAYSLSLSITSHKLYCAGADNNWVPRLIAVGTDSLKPIDTVPGLYPDGRMTYSPVTDRLYVPYYSESLFVVDCRNDSVRARLALRVRELAASTLDGRVYAAHYDSAEIVVVDTTDSVSGSIPLPTAADAEALIFSPDRNELYGVSDVVFVVDASADTVVGTLDYRERTPYRMVHNPAGNKLYLFCAEREEVLVMDSTFGTPKIIPRGAVNTRPQPVLDQALNRFYVAGSNRLRVIDCNSDSLLGSTGTPGIRYPITVLVPHMNKLYVFDSYGYGVGDSVYAYDGLRDEVSSVFHLPDAVRCAVYDPRSNRVFFACRAAPDVRVLDPVTDSVVKTFDFMGGSNHGRMALNVDLGRLYYTDMSSDRTSTMFTIDLLADSVAASEGLPWRIDSMFLNRRLGKLYMCNRDTARVLVYDCNRGVLLGTFNADYLGTGLMNDRNDKLYLGYGEVVDCRYDSIVTVLPPDSLNPRCMAWDAIDNRVFQATTSMLYVYRDDPYGMEERNVVDVGPRLTVLGNPARSVVNLKLQIPHGQTGTLTVHDATGRLVHSTRGLSASSCRLNLKSVPAGVYFVCLEVGRTRTTDKVILQH